MPEGMLSPSWTQKDAVCSSLFWSLLTQIQKVISFRTVNRAYTKLFLVACGTFTIYPSPTFLSSLSLSSSSSPPPPPPPFHFTLHNHHHHHHHQHHHRHHVPEGLGVFPLPWSSRWSWSLHLFLGRPMFLRPFGLYCIACFGSLFVSILCTWCSHFWFIL